jgi:hypothetical protein
VNFKYDEKVQIKFFDELWKLSLKLGVINNDIKISLMLVCLEFDWKRCRQNIDKFTEILKIPQNIHFFVVKGKEGKIYPNNSVFGWTGADYVDSHLLIKKYLLHFLSTLSLSLSNSSSSFVSSSVITSSKQYKEFQQYIEKDYLHKLYVEASILNGTMDVNKLSERVEDAGFIEQLNNRIDLTFVDQNQKIFHTNDEVSLTVNVKNVKKLFVHVYEINSFSYYSIEKKQIEAGVDLDGLVPGEKQEYDYSNDSPYIQRILKLTLPSLGFYLFFILTLILILILILIFFFFFFFFLFCLFFFIIYIKEKENEEYL